MIWLWVLISVLISVSLGFICNTILSQKIREQDRYVPSGANHGKRVDEVIKNLEKNAANFKVDINGR